MELRILRSSLVKLLHLFSLFFFFPRHKYTTFSHAEYILHFHYGILYLVAISPHLFCKQINASETSFKWQNKKYVNKFDEIVNNILVGLYDQQ